MKTNITPLILLLILSSFINFSTLVAQERSDKKDKNEEFKTIIGDKTPIGGYASLGAGYTTIDNMNAVTLHGRGGITIGHWISMGFSGATFFNEYQQETAGSNIEYGLTGGYGGLYMELITFPKLPVYISLVASGGIGAASYSRWDRTQPNNLKQTSSLDGESTFVIFEPSVELNLNATKWFKMCLFFNYKFTNGLSNSFVDLGITKYAIDGYSAGLNIKFGKF